MARPRKADPDRKTTRIAIRLTPAERLHIEQAAHNAGLSASAYVREQALHGEVAVNENRKLDHAVFRQVRRIGVNLNQLTKVANETGEMPEDLARVCAAVESILIRELEGVPMPDPGNEEPPDDQADLSSEA